MADAVRVLGLRDLQRAFAAADKAVKEDMRDALMEAAAPVRSEAQRLAGTEISHMGGSKRPWAGMRIGATGSAIVYVAPLERGVKVKGRAHLRRPNLALRLLEDAMEPALEHNTAAVERRVEKLLDEVADVWERT